MSDQKTFAVAMIGIPDQERSVLKNIFKLSLYRNYTYTLVSANEPSQILIVDADDSKAMTEWGALYKTVAHASSSSSGPAPLAIPAVMVTKEKLPAQFPYHIHRPFVATRVLSILDQIATRLPSFSQDRVIGETPSPIVTKEEPPAPTALVVDDSGTIRKQIELELKLFNIQVDTAESGEQAFDLLAQKSYDIVFLDVVLPGVDGYQICKAIKKDKAKKKMPVIMLTSKSSPFDRIKGALAGCDTYLTKPVKQSSFQKAVKKYLGI
jgi:two-component system, cell cycle response regulator